jgi:hypothetical protein
LFDANAQLMMGFFIENLIFYISGHDTGPGESGKKYRPLFLDHFDKKEAENIKVMFVFIQLFLLTHFKLIFYESLKCNPKAIDFQLKLKR